jgi:hypothetical protein
MERVNENETFAAKNGIKSFDVGKSKISEFLTMRDLTKSGTKEELAALCFSACKLNLPLVPSQDD